MNRTLPSIGAGSSLRPLAVLAFAYVSLAGGAPAVRASDAVRHAIALPNRPAAGARVFAQKGCTRCHTLGRQQSTDPRIGPALGHQFASGTVMDLAGALWNHAPVMHAKMKALHIDPPSMTSADVADVVAVLGVFRVPSVAAPGREGDPQAGRRVFAAKRCSACHVADGTSWNGPGPSLQKYRGSAAGIFLAQAMWNHSAAMGSAALARGIPWPTFAGREMDDLVAYLQDGIEDDANAPDYFDPGSPRRGRELFEEKQCVACHAIDGRGGRGGPDLGGGLPIALGASVPAIAGLMWNHSLTMAAEFKRRGIAFPTFSGQEMVDVISYLHFVNFATVRGAPARGRKLFADRCSACHVVEPGGRGVGPDLTVVPQLDEPFAIIAAMWNHVPRMASELERRDLAWPRFERGDADDLAAFLISRRR